MVKVKGIRIFAPIVVDLSEYFDQAESVTVRPLSPPARAKIQELTTAGMRYATTQRKKGLDIDSIEQDIPAEVTMQIRETKLNDGVTAHTLKGEDGKPLDWNKELQDALDEADPAILEKVLEAISEATYPDDEEGPDPTSPTPSAKK